MRRISLLVLLVACTAAGQAPAGLPAAPSPPAPTMPADPFEEWLAAPVPVADGFSAPVRGWGTCGDGCWTNERPSTVRVVADGVVRSAAGDTVTTEHLWYEDQEKHRGTFTYAGVTTALTVGQTVERGQPLGTASTVKLAASTAPSVDSFLASHPRLPVPQRERVLALVSHELRQLRLYVDGAPIGTYEVGFGQAEGDKELRGDNRTPKGLYYVVSRSTGPFTGDYGAYYGGHWIKLGYPNAWDAARGVDAGLFDAELQRSITRAFWSRSTPAQGTRLGGGIGLHGWAYEWADDGPRGLSWGCVVVHLRDVEEIYATLVEGALVALF